MCKVQRKEKAFKQQFILYLYMEEILQNCSITFDISVRRKVLNFLNKDVDNEGFIVEKENPKQKVLAFDGGQEVSLEEFGGVKKGSEVFIKDNLVSLMRLSKE